MHNEWGRETTKFELSKWTKTADKMGGINGSAHTIVQHRIWYYRSWAPWCWWVWLVANRHILLSTECRRHSLCGTHIFPGNHYDYYRWFRHMKSTHWHNRPTIKWGKNCWALWAAAHQYQKLAQHTHWCPCFCCSRCCCTVFIWSTTITTKTMTYSFFLLFWGIFFIVSPYERAP